MGCITEGHAASVVREAFSAGFAECLQHSVEMVEPLMGVSEAPLERCGLHTWMKAA